MMRNECTTDILGVMSCPNIHNPVGLLLARKSMVTSLELTTIYKVLGKQLTTSNIMSLLQCIRSRVIRQITYPGILFKRIIWLYRYGIQFCHVDLFTWKIDALRAIPNLLINIII